MDKLVEQLTEKTIHWRDTKEPLKEVLKDVIKMKLEAIEDQRYEDAANLRDKEKKILEELETI